MLKIVPFFVHKISKLSFLIWLRPLTPFISSLSFQLDLLIDMFTRFLLVCFLHITLIVVKWRTKSSTPDCGCLACCESLEQTVWTWRRDDSHGSSLCQLFQLPVVYLSLRWHTATDGADIVYICILINESISLKWTVNTASEPGIFYLGATELH